MKPGQWKSGRGFLLLPFNFHKRQNPKRRRRREGGREEKERKERKGKSRDLISHITPQNPAFIVMIFRFFFQVLFVDKMSGFEVKKLSHLEGVSWVPGCQDAKMLR